jgi:hypothetical protein
MGLAELGDFLIWGKNPGAAGLNRFGQGGKAAIGYLGRGVRVRAHRHDERTAYQFEDHDWLSRKPGELKRFIPQTLPAHLPGTGYVQIEIVNVRKAVNLRRLERELSWRYRPALEQGLLELNIGSHPVKPSALPAETRRSFAHEVLVPSLTDPSETVLAVCQGWVGTAQPKFEGRGGIRCSVHGRVVLQNEDFGHRTASFKASLNSLIGEVDLSFVPVVLNKNAFDTGTEGWNVAVQVMHAELQPVIAQLLHRKDEHLPSDSERMRAMEARDIACRILAGIAADDQRLGAAGLGQGRKPRESVGHAPRQAPPDRKPAAARQARTPSPPNAVGRLPRTGNLVDWDIRPLDPKIRSAVLLEAGRAEVIINNTFPLYIHRHGDLLYLIETGLLEELRPTEPHDKTVEELLVEFNDAVYRAAREVQHR